MFANKTARWRVEEIYNALLYEKIWLVSDLIQIITDYDALGLGEYNLFPAKEDLFIQVNCVIIMSQFVHGRIQCECPI